MTLPDPRADVTATFRDDGEPRALATRMIAVAHRHPRGWTLDIPEQGATQQFAMRHRRS